LVQLSPSSFDDVTPLLRGCRGESWQIGAPKHRRSGARSIKYGPAGERVYSNRNIPPRISRGEMNRGTIASSKMTLTGGDEERLPSLRMTSATRPRWPRVPFVFKAIRCVRNRSDQRTVEQKLHVAQLRRGVRWRGEHQERLAAPESTAQMLPIRWCVNQHGWRSVCPSGKSGSTFAARTAGSPSIRIGVAVRCGSGTSSVHSV